jgi:hypothetical protein
LTQNRILNYGDALPEQWVDQIQEFIGTYVSPNFRVSLVNATTVQVAASAGNGQVCAAVGAKWRYIVGNITAADPGGAAATHTLWLTATDNSFAPGPPESDSTVYAFGLEIRSSGTPAAPLSRQIGSVEWDGTSITRVILDIRTADWQDFTGGTAAATFLQARVRGDALPRVVLRADGTLLMGTGAAAQDVNLYRAGANDLRTDDSLGVRGDTAGAARFIDLYEPAGAAGSVRAFVAGDAQPRMRLGLTATGFPMIEAGFGTSPPDTNLYRSAADTWSTDDNLQVRGDVAGTARMLDVIAPNATTRMAVRAYTLGDTEARAEVGVDATGVGRLALGPGGAATPDTTLVRTSAGAVTMNGSLTAATLVATGAMTAPTRALDDGTTNVATTAFVTNQASTTTPVQVDDTAGAVGVSKRYARADHRHQLAVGIYDTTGTASRLNPMRVHTFFDGLGVSVDSDYNGADLREDTSAGWNPVSFGYVQNGFPYPRTAWAAIGGTVQWRWQIAFVISVASVGGTWTLVMRYVSIDADGNAGALAAVPGINGVSMAGATGLRSFDSGWQTAPVVDGMMLACMRTDRSGATVPAWSRSSLIIDVRNV